MKLCNSWLTLLPSLRYPRVSGLYLVYTLLHPICPNGCTQVLWDVTAIPVSDSVLFSNRLCPISPCFARVVDMRVLSSASFGHCRFRRMYDMCLLNLIATYFCCSFWDGFPARDTTKQWHGCSPPHGSWDTSNPVPFCDPGNPAAIDRRERIGLIMEFWRLILGFAQRSTREVHPSDS